MFLGFMGRAVVPPSKGERMQLHTRPRSVQKQKTPLAIQRGCESLNQARLFFAAEQEQRRTTESRKGQRARLRNRHCAQSERLNRRSDTTHDRRGREQTAVASSN